MKNASSDLVLNRGGTRTPAQGRSFVLGQPCEPFTARAAPLDDLDAATGVFHSVLLSVPLWILIALLVLALSACATDALTSPAAPLDTSRAEYLVCQYVRQDTSYVRRTTWRH